MALGSRVRVVIGGRPTPSEVETLLAGSALKMVIANRAVWMRLVDGWRHVPNVYAMAADDDEQHSRLVAEFNSWKFQ